MEATKIKKKLHGSILKGSKMKVEEARPEKRVNRDADEVEKLDAEAERKAKKVGKKRKREEGVLSGVELPKERKVKRGWTEPVGSLKNGKVKTTAKSSKDKGGKKAKAQTSLFSDGSECLFRTKLPPNTADVLKQSTDGVKDVGKKKKSKSTREILVHEFSNTTKHATFLRDGHSSNGKTASSEFVEGKGWIDEEGKIVEPPPKEQQLKVTPSIGATEERQSGTKKSAKKQEPSEGATFEDKVELADFDETSSSGISSSSDDDSVVDEPDEPITPSIITNGVRDNSAGNESDTTSSSGSSSSSVNAEADTTLPGQTVTSTETLSSEIHPLEALFKKPKPASSGTPRKPALEVKTTFSFFEPDDKNDDSTNRLIPQTPFTQRDLQYRSMRSAAPTPDTAAPNKTGFGNLWGRDDDIESENDGPDDHEDIAEHEEASSTPKAGRSISAEAPGEEKPLESDFSMRFV